MTQHDYPWNWKDKAAAFAIVGGAFVFCALVWVWVIKQLVEIFG